MKIQKKIDIELNKCSCFIPLRVVQYDTGIQLVITLLDFDIPSGTNATMFVLKPSGKFVYQEDKISISGNVITIDVENQAFTEHGKVKYQIELKNGSDVISTFSRLFEVEKSLNNSGAEESKSVIRAFDELTNEKIAEIVDATVKQIAILEQETVNKKAEIQAKGEATLATIPDDYTQTYDNADRALREKADAIVCSVSGSDIVIKDGSDNYVRGFELDGKGEQTSTTGKNLVKTGKVLNLSLNGCAFTSDSDETSEITISGTSTKEFSAVIMENITLPKGTYTVSVYGLNVKDSNFDRILLINDLGTVVTNYIQVNKPRTLVIEEEQTFNVQIILGLNTSYSNQTIKIQIETGTVATDYEPYTGCQPAPSVNYPQEIKSVGHKSRQLLPMDLQTKTVKGITFTIDEYGRVIANGTANDETTEYIDINRNGTVFEPGEYTLRGCPVGGSATTYRMYLYKNVNGENVIINSLFGTSVDFTLTEACNVWVRIAIESGVTVENLMFEPMIHKTSEKIIEFEPYTDKYIVGLKGTGKNLLKVTAVTQTVDGVQFTVNKDGSITANGTATANIYFALGKVNLADGDYKLSGCNGGATSTYLLYSQKADGSGYVHIIDGEKTFTISDNQERKLLIAIYNGVTVSNLTFYPMISVDGGEFEPYKEIVEYLYLDEPLRGLPVSDASLANYTDENGVMWCADKMDHARKKYMRRVDKIQPTLTGGNYHSNGNYYSVVNLDNKIGKIRGSLCNMAINGRGTDFMYSDGYYYENDVNFVFNGTSNDTLKTMREKLDGMELCYIIAKPIETDLSESEIAKLNRLQTFYPNTIYSNSDDANMVIDYNADTKLYIDNKLATISAQLL